MGENSQDNTQNGAPAGGLQKKTKIAYGVGAVGKDMVYMLVASYILYYYNSVLGVSSVFIGTVLMLANSEFLILLNQATTDRDELAALLNISDNQLSYITNVGAGHGLIRCSGNLVPFENSFPRNTKLYRLMTTKPGEA